MYSGLSADAATLWPLIRVGLVCFLTTRPTLCPPEESHSTRSPVLNSFVTEASIDRHSGAGGPSPAQRSVEKAPDPLGGVGLGRSGESMSLARIDPGLVRDPAGPQEAVERPSVADRNHAIGLAVQDQGRRKGRVRSNAGREKAVIVHQRADARVLGRQGDAEAAAERHAEDADPGRVDSG